MKARAVGTLKLRALPSISAEQSSRSHHNGTSQAVDCNAMPATGWLKWNGLQRAGLRPFAFLLLAALSLAPAFAGETVLHTFTPVVNGTYPSASVCFGPGGTYGTASGGGLNNAGLVWKSTIMAGKPPCTRLPGAPMEPHHTRLYCATQTGVFTERPPAVAHRVREPFSA